MERALRVIYMGTPRFALHPLTALAQTEDAVLVVTQPDRRAGRGRTLQSSLVKEAALARGIPCLQPERVREADVIAALEALQCDLIVVAAFGQILPKAILDIPKAGCINIHASLLPKYRGASPIPMAIAQGEKETGITTMMMDAGMDTGDILLQRRLAITDTDTAATLSERLSVLGADTILETVAALKGGRLTRVPQVESEATVTPRLRKSHGAIDWNRTPEQIRDHVRAMDPWPGAFTRARAEMLKIWRVTPHGKKGRPGEVLEAGARLLVGAREGSVMIEELQVAGRKRVRGEAFLRGRHPITEGMTLGHP
jgi:methionyl-tRNA formyltransferase